MITNVHVDCDPLWVYANEYGTAADSRSSAIYDGSLRTFLTLLAAQKMKATFFVVGRDLELPACVDFCRDALRAGHAIGNHTFSHLQDYRRLSRSAKLEEVSRCHRAILGRLHYESKGFRCPGYYFDDDISSILRELGYLYDTSILPGVGVHLMKLVYRLFNPAAKDKKFGRASYLFAPRAPYRLAAPARETAPLWEFPLATCPLFLLPIHSTFIFQWGLPYFQLVWKLSTLLRSHFLYLFHAIDLMDEGTAGALAARVSTFKRPLATREQIVHTLLDRIAEGTVALTEDRFASPATARSA